MASAQKDEFTERSSERSAMFSLSSPDLVGGGLRRTTLDNAAKARWENEGGAPAAPARESDLSPSPDASVRGTSSTASAALDARQDEIMTIASADGRPPSRWQRLAQWRWLGIGAVLILAAIAVWIAIRGVSALSVAAGIGLVVLLFVGASPVLGAGLMRGSEGRAARRTARLERRARRDQ